MFRLARQVATNSAGIRITQVGISEPYAADYQFVFNSDWPSLAIAFDQVVTVAAAGVGQVTHGLGFFPLTMAWYSVGGVSVGRFYATTSFDKQKVYIDNTLNTSDVTVDIKCYNVDISVSKDYTLPQFPLFKTPYDPTTGIKVVKYGKSIASDDLRDFILHSRAQSPALLSLQTQSQGVRTGFVTNIAYTNPAGYTPWILGFINTDGTSKTYQCFPPGSSQNTPAFFQLGAKSVVSLVPGTVASLVVLRDPLVVANTLRVIY